jgi:hypothetical protein
MAAFPLPFATFAEAGTLPHTGIPSIILRLRPDLDKNSI